MGFLIDVQTLATKMNEQADELVIIDVRFDLFDVHAGEKAYKQGHLPGAHYLHIDNDLSSEMKEHGGNHPLPELNQFTETLNNLGITAETMVVFYDDGNNMFAPRAWWLLHYFGHDHCYVLNGGFDEWVKQGYEVITAIPPKKQGSFKPQIRENLTIDINELKEKLAAKEAYLIDSRAKDRYLGKTETLYEKAGHIPGAVNYFWQDVLNDDGDWKDKDELEAHFKSFNKQDNIIVSCGSGISACVNFLALKKAGYENVKLYPGSFSDWISYEENDVETDENLI